MNRLKEILLQLQLAFDETFRMPKDSEQLLVECLKQLIALNNALGGGNNYNHLKQTTLNASELLYTIPANSRHSVYIEVVNSTCSINLNDGNPPEILQGISTRTLQVSALIANQIDINCSQGAVYILETY